MQLRSNTFVAGTCIEVRLYEPPLETPAGKFEGKLPVTTANNVFTGQPKDIGFVYLNAFLPPEKLSTETALRFVREVLVWQGNNDLFARDSAKIRLAWRDGSAKSQDVKELAELSRYFATGSVVAPEAVRFKGGNLFARIYAAPENLLTEDFRLADGSAGKGAGPGGKDVGADVDLVGPGAAYEKWKKTKEHEEWRKQTNALMASAAALAPFVILAKDNRAESQHAPGTRSRRRQP